MTCWPPGVATTTVTVPAGWAGVVTVIDVEEIAFTYQQIKWTWEEDGFTTQDNWKAM